MSNQLPAYLQKASVPSLAARLMANIGTPMPPRISIKGNRFSLIEADGTTIPIQTLHLDVIIVDANDHISKQYREGDWDPNDLTPPDCFSDNGIGPSTQSTRPQHSDCLTCRWNERGSAVSKLNGAAIKACRDQQKLAVMIGGDQRHAMYLLTVTPGSLKNFRNYMTMLTGGGVEPWQIGTRLEFDTNGVGMLKFSPAPWGWVPEASVPSITAAIETRAGIDIYGGRDKPRGADQALPAPTLQIPQAQAPQAPIVQAPPPPRQKTPEEIEAEEFAAFKAQKQAQAAYRPQPEATNPIEGQAVQQMAANTPQPPQPEAPRGRGRPRKDGGAPPVQPQGPVIDLPNPLGRPQMQQAEGPQFGASAPQVSNGATPQFGIVQNAAAPAAEVSSMLDSLFAGNLPT